MSAAIRHRDETSSSDPISDIPICEATFPIGPRLWQCDLPRRHSGYHQVVIYWIGDSGVAEKG